MGSFESYLSAVTERLITLLGANNIEDEEKSAIIAAVTMDLTGKMDDVNSLEDYDFLIYSASLKYIDSKLTEVTTTVNPSYKDCEYALNLCGRQRNIISLFEEHGWELPELRNIDAKTTSSLLRNRLDELRLAKIIVDCDNKIANMIHEAAINASVDVYDSILEEINNLSKLIEEFNSKYSNLPNIRYEDTKSAYNAINGLKGDAQKRILLEKLNKRTLLILSEYGFSDSEKKDIAADLSVEFANGTSNSEDTDSVIYYGLACCLDKRISAIANKKNSKREECVCALSYCNKLSNIIDYMKKSSFLIPQLANANIGGAEALLKRNIEMYDLAEKIVYLDNQLTSELISLNDNQSIDKCDQILNLISDIEDILTILKQNYHRSPVINYSEDDKTRNHILTLKNELQNRNTLLNSLVNYDNLINSVINSNEFDYEKCRQMMGICATQNSLIEECKSKGIPLPRLEVSELGSVSNRFKHYTLLHDYDMQIIEKRNNLGRQNINNELKDLCIQQQKNIEYCLAMRWPVPKLNEAKPKRILDEINKEENKKLRAKRAKTASIIAVACIALTVMLVIMGIIVKIMSSAKIPFDYDYAVGQDLDDINSKLSKAGFVNIDNIEDTSGWYKSGTVTDVVVSNQDAFAKGQSFNKKTRIEVYYSSDDRICINDLLDGWEKTRFYDVAVKLQSNGFSNVLTSEVDTFESGKDGLTNSIIINGSEYKGGACYVPEDSSFIINYYHFVVSIGKTNAEYIGMDYNDVQNMLVDSGFTNVICEESFEGWSEDNSVVEVIVNGNTDYLSNSAFAPETPIVIKYSSTGRTNMTSLMDESNAFNLKYYLNNAGITDVTLVRINTDSMSENGIIQRVLISEKEYQGGECYLNSKSQVVIEYCYLTICIGSDLSTYYADTEGYYSTVVQDLQAKGFTNITLYRNNTLIFGILDTEGSVESIKINGETADANTYYEYDAPIEIVVHTFSSGCDDITLIKK